MPWTRWLSWLRLVSRRPRRTTIERCRPRLEILEDRQLLTTFTVVLPTDTGPATGAGQRVTATSGDLRYCIEKADATHPGKSDTIAFSPKVFTRAQTITLNAALGTLTLSDSYPLTIKGPAGGKGTVSGGDQIGVFAITSGTAALRNLAITHGNAPSGGGIDNSGTLTLFNCTLNHDSASGTGGGIDNFGGGTITLTHCTLIHDSAAYAGGIGNLSGTVTLTNCTLSNNAGRSGGGIENIDTVKLTNCTLSNNASSDSGGGIYNYIFSTATLTRCTLSNNTAQGSGGGIGSEGTASLTSCTLSNNTATSGLGGGFNNSGGTATLTNCTLSNNAATTGGGLCNFEGTVTLTSCTLRNNAATTGGGICNGTNCTLNLTNTLVADNTAAADPDIDGTVSTADHNLIGNASGSTGIEDQLGGNLVGGKGNAVIDPRLGPLQNNGGPTQTLALLPGSPAIGQADNAFVPKTDQRGHVRNIHKPTDIGAFET